MYASVAICVDGAKVSAVWFGRISVRVSFVCYFLLLLFFIYFFLVT